MNRLIILLSMLAFLVAACGTSQPLATPSVASSPPATPTPTATLPVTPASPTPTATPLPVEGTLTIKVNVRSGPGTSYDSLGFLDAGQQIQVILQDRLGAWYQILYPAAPSGLAWVTAQYVTLAAGTQVPFQATATPAGPSGQLTQRLNVRSGPSTTFDTLGLLDAGSLVSLTGKNAAASWFQIDYPAGPGGKGWVTSQYIQTDASSALQVIDEYGNVVTSATSGTPTGPALTPTPTIGFAFEDGDSASNPARSIDFSASATSKFSYSSRVSAPQGDPEDWIEFTPYAPSGTTAHLYLSLLCTGNDSLQVGLWQAGELLSDWDVLTCGDERMPMLLTSGQTYQISLSPTPADGSVLVSYTLTVENNP